MNIHIKRAFIIIGAVMLQLCLGAIYSWTLFNEPLHAKFGWEISDIIVNYSLTIFMFAFTTIFSGRLLDRFGARKIATIGGILYGCGVMLTSRADTLMELYIFYGVIAGIGVGFAYVCPLTTCIRWFPKKKGLVTGIVIGAFGLGSLIFKSIIQSSLKNNGVSETFFILGLIYLILSVLGAQFLSRPPKVDKVINSDGSHDKDMTVRHMIRTRNFYFIWLSYFFGCISGLLVIGSAVNIGLQMVELSIKSAAQAVVVIAIFNAFGRLFWGTISDHIGYKKSTFLMFLITALAMTGLSLLQLNIALFYILMALIAFCFGGFLVVYPAITSVYFGTKNLGRNYGVVYQAYGFAALCGPVILKNTGSFVTAFIISGILSLAGSLLVLQIRSHKSL